MSEPLFCKPAVPIGLLGGSFDPIHHGHLRMAEELADALDLTQVHILPTGKPPHRQGLLASAQDRLEMVKLAIANNPRFVLDQHEIDKNVPCYMVDTLSELRAEMGQQRPIILFLGVDAFLGLESWHRWRKLFDLAHIAVARRPGHDLEASLSGQLKAVFSERHTCQPSELGEFAAGRIYCHSITQLDISASLIRGLVAHQHSPRYLVPDAVLDYINHHQLYC